MAVVFTVDEPPKGGDGDGGEAATAATINMARACGDGWAYDWLFRALRMLEEDIRKIPVPGVTGLDDVAAEVAAEGVDGGEAAEDQGE